MKVAKRGNCYRPEVSLSSFVEVSKRKGSISEVVSGWYLVRGVCIISCLKSSVIFPCYAEVYSFPVSDLLSHVHAYD